MSAGFVKKTDRLFGIDFYTGNRADLVTALLNERADSVRLVVTCNLDHLYLIEQDPAFLDAYRAAWVATVDEPNAAAIAAWRDTADLVVDLVALRLRPGRD